MYYQHSGYPGGLKETNLTKVMVKDPSMPIVKAVRGMLPVNKLRDGQQHATKSLRWLRPQNHAAQGPKPLN